MRSHRNIDHPSDTCFRTCHRKVARKSSLFLRLASPGVSPKVITPLRDFPLNMFSMSRFYFQILQDSCHRKWKDICNELQVQQPTKEFCSSRNQCPKTMRFSHNAANRTSALISIKTVRSSTLQNMQGLSTTMVTTMMTPTTQGRTHRPLPFRPRGLKTELTFERVLHVQAKGSCGKGGELPESATE